MVLDSHTVVTILAEELHLTEWPITVDEIAQAAAQKFGMRLGIMRGPSRRASIVTARHLAMYLARTLTARVSQSSATTSVAETQPVSAMPANRPLDD